MSRHPFVLAVGATSAAAVTAVSRAHVGLPPEPHDLWTSWNASPPLVGVVLTLSLLYVRGFRLAPAVKRWQAACFGGAVGALLVALVSPLDALATSLLTAHMVQHLLLLMVVPPLLVLSTPGYVLAWSVPRSALRAAARRWNRSQAHSIWGGLSSVLLSPLGALLVSIGVVWLWHAPFLYQAALASETVHLLEHATFVAAAYLFWSVVLAPLGRHRVNHGAAAAMLFASSLAGSGLGALMALSPVPWYQVYSSTAPAWGLSAIEDQQLAGVLMWMPVGMVYVLLTCLLVWLWLRDRPPGARLSSATGGE